jgi:hypothetical protein
MPQVKPKVNVVPREGDQRLPARCFVCVEVPNDCDGKCDWCDAIAVMWDVLTLTHCCVAHAEDGG